MSSSAQQLVLGWQLVSVGGELPHEATVLISLFPSLFFFLMITFPAQLVASITSKTFPSISQAIYPSLLIL